MEIEGEGGRGMTRGYCYWWMGTFCSVVDSDLVFFDHPDPDPDLGKTYPDPALLFTKRPL